MKAPDPRTRNKQGETRRELLEFLERNGPATRREIEKRLGIAGYKTTLGAIAVGQVGKTEIINPEFDPGIPNSRVRAVAYKFLTYNRTLKNREIKDGVTWNERRKRDALKKRIETAISLLLENGYRVEKT